MPTEQTTTPAAPASIEEATVALINALAVAPLVGHAADARTRAIYFLRDLLREIP